MNRTKLAFVGLGEMGSPMASRLIEQGWQLAGLDQSDEVQMNWQAQVGMAAHAIEDSDVLMICVTDESASRQVVGTYLNRLRPGCLIIDHSTTSPAWAREVCARASSAGIHFCDAPLSGGATGARLGELVVMLGAAADQVPRVKSICSAFASKLVHLGPPGCGQACKMANQLAIAGVAAGLADAIAISRAEGLPTAQVLEVLASGSADSVQLSRLRPALAQTDSDARQLFGWMQKDLRICAEAARRASVRLPLTRLWQEHWVDWEDEV